MCICENFLAHGASDQDVLQICHMLPRLPVTIQLKPECPGVTQFMASLYPAACYSLEPMIMLASSGKQTRTVEQHARKHHRSHVGHCNLTLPQSGVTEVASVRLEAQVFRP